MIGEGFQGVLTAARLGSEWAWTDIYRNLAPSVVGYLRAQRAYDPEDLTSEVFFQVVKSLGKFEGDEGAFRSWIFVIAHRKVIDDARYRRRRPTEPVGMQVLEAIPATGNVEDAALNGLTELDITSLLDELTSEQRDVLLLRILGGLTVPEVAAAIGKRNGAVEALQRRALSRLRKRLASR